MKKQIKIPTANQYQTVSPATKLLEKRRKMYQIHEAFQVQKQEFKSQQAKFKSEEETITKKDQQLQNQLINFCQFLTDNQSKRKKTEERFRLQEKAYEEKEVLIKNLERDIEQLSRNQKKYMNKVAHLRKYEQYLQKVRSTYSDQYPQMFDILNRYQTLKKSNDDLIKTTTHMEGQYESLKKHTLTEEKRLNQSILTINNQLKQISRRIQSKISEKNELQSEVQKSNEDFSNKNLNLGKIFMAIDNLNYRCNEHSHKMKYEFDQKGNLEKKEIKTQTITKKLENQSNSRNDEELSYEQRSKQAAGKLKNIISHMKDLKSIIDEFKIRTQVKPEKPERY